VGPAVCCVAEDRLYQKENVLGAMLMGQRCMDWKSGEKAYRPDMSSQDAMLWSTVAVREEDKLVDLGKQA
jgi:hypothetical protein